MRLLSDVNFDGRVVRALMSRCPELDLLRAQDVELDVASDERMLEWAAEMDRVVLTHDRKTMAPLARERFLAGLPMPGVLMVSRTSTIREAVDDLLIVLNCSEPDDWPDRVCVVPLR